jgi:hypothetical protein
VLIKCNRYARSLEKWVLVWKNEDLNVISTKYGSFYAS